MSRSINMRCLILRNENRNGVNSNDRREHRQEKAVILLFCSSRFTRCFQKQEKRRYILYEESYTIQSYQHFSLPQLVYWFIRTKIEGQRMPRFSSPNQAVMQQNHFLCIQDHCQATQNNVSTNKQLILPTR